MNQVLDFSGSHPGLAFLCLVVAAVTVASPFWRAFKSYNRRLRSRNIDLHGWPHPPLDADGDVVYPRDRQGGQW
jgi:hypothetical protein